MYSEEKRNEIKQMYMKYKSIRIVSKKANVSTRTVNNIINYKESRLENISGRPKKLTERDTTRIRRFCKSECQKGNIVNSNIVKKNLDLEVCKRTVTRKIKEIGLSYSFVQKKLPLSSDHMASRLEFAKYHLIQKTDFLKSYLAMKNASILMAQITLVAFLRKVIMYLDLQELSAKWLVAES